MGQSEWPRTVPPIHSVESFRHWVSQFLFPEYRFGSAFFGRGSTHSLGVTIDCEICVNLSDAYRATLKSPSGGIHSAPLQQWFQTLKPQTYDLMAEDATISQAWAENFAKFGFTNLIIHGHVDADDGLMTVFGFYNYPQTSRIVDQEQIAALAHVVHLAMRQIPVAPVRDRVSLTSYSSEAALTAKENEILEWVSVGKTNSEIASILEISPNTVRNHIAKIMKKLSVFNRTQAAVRNIGLPNRSIAATAQVR